MSERKVRVAIVGALGYGGIGATEILLRHPQAELVHLLDVTDIGKSLSSIYPHLAGHCDMLIEASDGAKDDVDVVLFSTPDGVGQKFAKEWLDKGVRVIDYSGDFRFNDIESYSGYAKRIGRTASHENPSLLPESVYGVPELHRQEIKKARVVGNPGCLAITTILGLAPLVKNKLIKPESIICDCKTGVSGAGKKASPQFHYPARYDSMNAYRISGHQHVYEIERELSLLYGKEISITFTPHVVPMTRGILATLYADSVSPNISALIDAYKTFYKDSKFVRIIPPELSTSTSDVRGSNYVNIWVNIEKRTGKAVIVSHIDNLMKGQAGNAIQNLNVMMGLDETLGLDHPGMYP